LHFDNTLTFEFTKGPPTDTAQLINVNATLVGKQLVGTQELEYRQVFHFPREDMLNAGPNAISISMDATKADVENVFGSVSTFDSHRHLENITYAVSLNGGPAEGSPEPATLTLLGVGLAGMAGYAWRRRKKQQATT
jgi:hypothetical protein